MTCEETAAGRPTHRSRGVYPGLLVAVVLAHLGYWLYCFRFHILQGDDHYNATVSGHPYGKLSIGEWFASYVYDYTSLNGRFADTLVRAFLAPGQWFWQLMGPVIFTLVIILMVVLVRRGRPDAVPATADAEPTPQEEPDGTPGRGRLSWLADETWHPLILLTGAATLFPVMIATKLAVAGDVLFWMSATVSYVVTVFFAMVGGYVLIQIARGLPVHPLTLGIGAAAIIVTHLMHEQGSTCMAAMVIVTWIITPRGSRGPALWICTAASATGLLAQAVAPGYRLRLAEFNSPSTAQSGNRLAQLANGSQALVDTGWSFVVAASVLVVAAVWLRRRTPLLLIAGSCALVGGIGSWTLSRMRLTRESWRVMSTTGPFTSWKLTVLAAVAVLLLLICVVGLATVTLAGVPELGPVPAVAVFAAMGAGAIPLVIGLLSFRAYLPTNVWLAIATLAAAQSLLDTLARTRPARGWARRPILAAGLVGATLALAVGSSVLPAAKTVRGMQLNAGVWEKTARQIDAARAGKCTQVGMPARWKMPAYLYTNGIQSPRYAEKVHRYHDLPASVKLVYGGTPVDCDKVAR